MVCAFRQHYLFSVVAEGRAASGCWFSGIQKLCDSASAIGPDNTTPALWIVNGPSWYGIAFGLCHIMDARHSA